MQRDTLLVITFSGRTPELLSFLQHISTDLPLIALTSYLTPSTCPLFLSRSLGLSILLPAPIPTSEKVSFGVAAPTTSITVALTLSDALALAVARRLHLNVAAVFNGYHPGGAIGVTNRVDELYLKNSSIATAVVL
jgi:D-arabinose 5-phosphate isomerase GutQ